MNKQNWTKLGHIFRANANSAYMFSHASVPIVRRILGNDVEVYFSTRNRNQEGSIAKLIFDFQTLQVKYLSDRPLLSKGQLGCFDDSGVMGSCLINQNNREFLYYIGWNLGVSVPFRNSIGLAELDEKNNIFVRTFEGPVLDRTKDEPHFCASNCVLFENGLYKIWYLSCTAWEKLSENKVRHRYHIKYATSKDGFNWNRLGDVAIDYSTSEEYAISVPRIVKDNGLYKMWFSSRGSRSSDFYRINYAESTDGINWRRFNDFVTFDGYSDGWDSEMQCYPFIFDFNGTRYMLYNGNGYGLTGFGLARLNA
jgi:hypothetical protein